MKKFFLLFLCLVSVIFLTGCEDTDITFDTNGGAPTISGAYSKESYHEKITIVPTKEGYIFGGWYTDASFTKKAPERLTATDNKFTVYAKWVSTNCSYYVNHYQEGLNQAYSIFETESLSDLTDKTVTATPKTYSGFTENTSHPSRKASGKVLPNGTLTLELYYSRNSYTITIDENGGDEVGDIVQKYQAEITPPTMTRTGFSFVGWEPAMPTTMPLNGGTYKALWQGESDVAITFNSNGGSFVSSQIIKIGEKATTPDEPSKKGYTFGGWYSEITTTTPYDFDQTVLTNITLYAKWLPATASYKVEHYQENLNGSYSLIDTDNLNGTTQSSVIATPKTYQGFSENLNHPNRFVEGEIIGDDSLCLKVFYTRNTYLIIIDEAGGIEVNDLSVKFGQPIPNLPTLIRIGYDHFGWENTLGPTMPAEDVTIKAKWDPKIVTYTTENYMENADDDNYTKSVSTSQAYAGTHVVLDTLNTEYYYEDLNNPERVGEGIVAGDGSLVLKVFIRRKVFEVKFEEDGGSEVANISKKFNATLQKPTDPVKLHYTFLGWYTSPTGNEIYNFTKMPLGGVTLYAKWSQNIYTISFESNAQISVTSISGHFDEAIVEPQKPIRTGYKFIGWYKDIDLTIPYIFEKMPGENITLYAKWESLPMTMTFNSVGGSSVAAITQLVGSTVEKPIPTKEGYVFENWYLDDNYINVFNNWVMPTENTVLYAKWTPVNYTIAFDSQGGSLVESISAPYLSVITEPHQPSKFGFVFIGWYKDAELTQEFIFTTMPLNGAVLYAKWVDESEGNPIINILKEEAGTYLYLEGYVFGKMTKPYIGFYVLDSTGAIFVLADQDLVSLGDKVSLNGYFESAPMINGVENLTIISQNNTINPKQILTVAQINNLEYSIMYNNLYLQSTGLLLKEDNDYYLMDAYTYEKVKISNRFNNFPLLDDYLNKLVKMDLVLLENEVGIVIIETINETNANLLTLASAWFNSKYQNKEFYSHDYFAFEWKGYYGTTLSYQIESQYSDLYDQNNCKFNLTEIETTINFTMTLAIENDSINFIVAVILKPIVSVSVNQFLTAGEVGECFYLEGMVVADFADYVYILKDATGFVYIKNSHQMLSVGDEVKLIVQKQKDNLMVYADCNKVNENENDNVFVTIISENNLLNLTPDEITLTQAVNLSATNPENYGRFIQIRGFLRQSFDEYNHGYYLENDNQKVSIYPVDYNGFEVLANYLNLEVNIRVYVGQNYDGNWEMLFTGTPGDIQIPEYTNQELVDAIQAMFIYEYAGKVFHPFESFDLAPSHPVLGATISYSFVGNFHEYYDDESKMFKFVDEAVDISINIVITKDSTSLNFTYNTQIVPLEYETDFYNLGLYEYAYLKGLIIYRNRDFAYLLTSEGIIHIDVYDLDCYKGDLVVLYGSKTYSNYEYGESMLYEGYNQTIPSLVKIISRNNPVVIPIELMTINTVNNLDPHDTTSYTRYVELSGYLTDEYYEFALSRGFGSVKVITSDEYTYYQLQPSADKEVTLRGFILDYDEYNQEWIIMYTGMDEATSEKEYTDLEKFEIIKNELISLYQSNQYYSNKTINLYSQYPQFSNSIVYETLGDNSAIIDLQTGLIASVTEMTLVDMKATINVGEYVGDFNFTITVLPQNVVVNPTLLTISEVKAANMGDICTFQGILKAIGSFGSSTYFLLEDGSGMIYVKINQYYYYFTKNDIGKMVSITGALTNIKGRKEVVAESYQIINSWVNPNTQFIDINIADLVSMDHRDDDIFGRSITIKGKLEIDDSYNYYIIENGEKVYLHLLYDINYTISNYVGYDIELKGFIYGYLELDDYYHMIVIDSNYYSPVINLKDYTDEEIVEIIKNQLIKEYVGLEYWPNTTAYFVANYQPFPNAVIGYIVTQGSEYVYSYYTNLDFYNTETDQIIRVTCEIVNGAAQAQFTFDITLKGIALNNFEDLFTLSPNSQINLQATVLYQMFGFTYFLIQGNIYYLEYNFDTSFNEGQSVIIIGKKRITDGVIDYAYDIKTISSSTPPEMFEQTPTSYSLQQLYLNQIEEKYISVFGVLQYDKYVDMLYLEHLGYKLYLRSDVLNNDEEPYDYEDKITGYMIRRYIGEEVILNVLFPDKFIYGDIYLADFCGYYRDFMTPTYSEEEHLEKVYEKMLRDYNETEITSGNYLDLPTYDEIHQVNINYSLVNQTDNNYLDLDSMKANLVSQSTTVSLLVTLNSENFNRSFTINVIVKPLEMSTIKEVLWGIDGEVYYLEGIVQAFHPDYWVIIKDATGMIYLEEHTNDAYFETGIRVGDKIQVIGKRSYYSTNDYCPCMSILVGKLISSGNSVTKDPLTFNFNDILALDYLSPDTYVKYIRITGEVVFTGNYWYPSYAIKDLNGTEYELEMEGQTNDDFNQLMNGYLGSTITVDGYLVGFYYIYSPFNWYLLHDVEYVNQ